MIVLARSVNPLSNEGPCRDGGGNCRPKLFASLIELRRIASSVEKTALFYCERLLSQAEPRAANFEKLAAIVARQPLGNLEQSTARFAKSPAVVGFFHSKETAPDRMLNSAFIAAKRTTAGEHISCL